MKNKGAELWDYAKKLIPGGNQLLSKRPERFLPGLWPTYYTKAKGCKVWDLEDRVYWDFAQMGVGACALGYSDTEINNAVIKAIRSGSMCTLNAIEEIELTERLLGLHPWAQMARYTRTGGEACAMAVRIARAASGRDKVAFCGYHGWHDWYLAANLADIKNLDGQLLPGLKPCGVPRVLRESSLPFYYNRLDTLESVIEKYPGQVGVIIMEPSRNIPPAPGFLQGVRKLADKIKAVLIFDEITSGFRMNLGGFHLLHAVEPDMAIFGKALGNGFPISAVIGRREVMQAAQDSFISTTFGTERIGFVAANATLKKMERLRVQDYLIRYGEMINRGWEKIAANQGLEIKISGIPPLTHLEFKLEDNLGAQTFYAQEMLEKGYLLGQSVYTTYAYTGRLISRFIEDSEEVFQRLKRAVSEDKLQSMLKGERINVGFARLN